MFPKLRLFFIAFIFVTLFSMPVHAEEEATEKETQTESVHQRVGEFTRDLDEPSKQHFYALYGSYNMVKVVEGVREQVGDAVEKCADVNPDMKEALETRFEEWDDALEPIMDDAEANVDNMIIAQDYAKRSDFKKLFKFVDEVRARDNEALEKYPVTTPEACEYLRAKMDETQVNLTNLLQSTLVSLPQSMIQDIEEQKAKEEAAQDSEDTQPE